MENQKKEEKQNPGRDLIVAVGGGVFGMGAGVLVGGVALGIIENIPNIGKPLKLLLKLGAYGLDLVTAYTVSEKAEECIGALYDGISAIGKMFSPKVEIVATPVEVKGEVK